LTGGILFIIYPYCHVTFITKGLEIASVTLVTASLVGDLAVV